MNNKKSRAFSLVEISISILVIAILSSGIYIISYDLYRDYQVYIAGKLTKDSPVNRIESLSLWIDFSNPYNYLDHKNKFPSNDYSYIGRLADQNPLSTDPFFTLGIAFNRTGINGLSCNWVNGWGGGNIYSSEPNKPFSNFISYRGYTYFLVSYIDDPDRHGGSVFDFHTRDKTNPYSIYFGYFQNGGNLVFNSSALSVSRVPKKPFIFSYVLDQDRKILSARYNRGSDFVKNNYQDDALKSADLSNIPVIRHVHSDAIGQHWGQFCLGELIMFSEPLSNTQITNIERYLAKKWNIVLENP